MKIIKKKKASKNEEEKKMILTPKTLVEYAYRGTATINKG